MASACYTPAIGELALIDGLMKPTLVHTEGHRLC